MVQLHNKTWQHNFQYDYSLLNKIIPLLHAPALQQTSDAHQSQW
jgi:hypothetical protein